MAKTKHGLNAFLLLSEAHEIETDILAVMGDSDNPGLFQTTATSLNQKLQDAQARNPGYFNARVKVLMQDANNQEKLLRYPVIQQMVLPEIRTTLEAFESTSKSAMALMA